MHDAVRTPDERFDDLPGWPYRPRYTEWEGLRLARVDEGEGRPVVLVHGEPTWGFLWRQIVPPLLDAGVRVVVPDQVGFGRSDKPTDRDWYSYERLTASFAAHLAAVLDDEPVTLVVHDWGGPVGLRWAVENPHRVRDLVILDTGLYRPGGRMSPAWEAFRDHVAASEELPIGQLIQGATTTELTAEVIAGYEAPFPDETFQAGVVALPLLVPTSDDAPAAAAMHRVLQGLEEWERPTLVLWAEDDPILPLRVGERMAAVIPGAQLRTVPGSHFLQEDSGPQIGREIAAFTTA
jgi:haloalkane dehalogenase